MRIAISIFFLSAEEQNRLKRAVEEKTHRSGSKRVRRCCGQPTKGHPRTYCPNSVDTGSEAEEEI